MSAVGWAGICFGSLLYIMAAAYSYGLARRLDFDEEPDAILLSMLWPIAWLIYGIWWVTKPKKVIMWLVRTGEHGLPKKPKLPKAQVKR